MDKTDSINEAVNTCESQSDPAEVVAPIKKKFQAPEISVPVDVLEATTFFQLTDSGSTT